MRFNRGPSWRERFARFMAGRYGIDRLYHFLIIICLILIVVNLFARSIVISTLEFAVLIYATYRVLSRNVYKRQKENLAFLKFIEKPKEFFKLVKCKFRDRKTRVYKKCPACKNNLRLPKQKGKHTVVCPCCQNRFDVRI
ncbi:MAG: hypothetical protein J6K85_02620 [Clostridia bacterium]|nr:hypothetical protein [Clostridia bacterium]